VVLDTTVSGVTGKILDEDRWDGGHPFASLPLTKALTVVLGVTVSRATGKILEEDRWDGSHPAVLMPLMVAPMRCAFDGGDATSWSGGRGISRRASSLPPSS
jgi:hypothetical protein